jgi:hypothetical protein
MWLSKKENHITATAALIPARTSAAKLLRRTEEAEPDGGFVAEVDDAGEVALPDGVEPDAEEESSSSLPVEL